MTANAEATGAREALTRAMTELELSGWGNAALIVKNMRDGHYPAPAPRRVRAEMHMPSTGFTAKWIGDEYVLLTYPSGSHLCLLLREDIQALAALDASADAEGMVEEGLGAAAPKSEATVIPRGSQTGTTSPAPTFITLAGMPAGSCNVAGCGCQMGAQSSGTAPPNDDPPASRVAGQSDAPSPQNGAQAGEAGSAVWWAVFDKDGRPDELWSTEEGARQSAARDMPQWAPYTVLPVVPASELVRVQRERDEAMNEMMHWNGESVRLENECATLRAQLASALDAARKELQSAQRDLDAALDRARVAEQRIETGVVCWARESGCAWNREPTPSEVTMYGPFTRGRFVADQEGT